MLTTFLIFRLPQLSLLGSNLQTGFQFHTPPVFLIHCPNLYWHAVLICNAKRETFFFLEFSIYMAWGIAKVPIDHVFCRDLNNVKLSRP